MAKYRLGEVAPIQQSIPPMEYPCWLLNLDMVESNTGRILEYVYVQPDEIGSSTVSFNTDNVLYSKLRPYLNKVVLPDRAGFATSEMLPLRPDTTIITREYLTYFLRSPHFVGYINDKTSGAKMPRANISDLKAVEIECPSLERQKTIVGIFEHLTNIIDLYQRQLLALDTLIKVRFVEMFGVPELNSMGWPTETLGNLLSVEPQNGLYKPQSDYVQDGTGTPILRIDAFYDGKVTSFSGLKRLNCTESERIRYLLHENDIVINRVNSIEYLGKCAWIKGMSEPTVFESNMMRFHIDESRIDPCYLTRLLCSTFIYNQILVRAKKAVNQASINQNDVQCFSIIVPPIELQKQFAVFVARIDKSKVAVLAALDKAQLLFDSLMQQYFG